MSGFEYDSIGRSYGTTRRADPRIQLRIEAALGGAERVVNVGAGTGSYEPRDREVIAVDPSAVMVGQRPRRSAPAVRAMAEDLPFRRCAFDAALAVLTLHHWTDWKRGLLEMRRVASGPVVLLTWDPDGPSYWLVDRYFPEITGADRTRFPSIGMIEATFDDVEVQTVTVPDDCSDGFLGAFWKRPTAYLEPEVRAGISVLARVAQDDPRLLRLSRDLEDGTWHREHEFLADLTELDIGYRLLVCN